MIRITRLRLIFSIAAIGLAPAAWAALQHTPANGPAYLVLETDHVEGNEDNARSHLVQYAVRQGTLAREDRVQFTHLPGEGPRGDISHDGEHAYIVVKRDAARETADLLHVRGAQVETWSTTVYPGSRPCSSPTGDLGGVYVTMGLPEGPGNNVHIAHFDPAGNERRLFASHALALHLIAVRPSDLLIYRVTDDQAALLRVARDTGALLRETRIPGYARDFSLGDGRVFYSNRSEHDDAQWLAQSWDPNTGALRTLFEAADQSPMLFGDVTVSDANGSSYITDRDSSQSWLAERQTSASGGILLRSTVGGQSWLLGNEQLELEGVGFAAGETLR